MLTQTQSKAKGLADLPPVNSDSLLALIALANADPRPDKIDVGVGVFRDAVGNTPILKVIKEAEQRLLDTQVTKAYLGSAGDVRFAELLRPILLGNHANDDRIAGLQTPGGCGALRLGFELIATANPSARVFVGTPTWPNHPPLIRSVRLEQVDYPYYERGQAVIRFDAMIEALESAAHGDVARVSARSGDVVDAARPWRRSGAYYPRRCRASRALAGGTGGHARPDQFGASAHRLGRSAAGLHRQAIRHVLDASAQPRTG